MQNGGRNRELMMLNCDAALIKDQQITDSETGRSTCTTLGACPDLQINLADPSNPGNTKHYAEEYKNNNDAFLDDFRASYQKMIEWGYGDGELTEV